MNSVPPQARAVLKVRVHPGQDSVEAQEAVMEHLREVRPFGVAIDVRPGPIGHGFAAVSTWPRGAIRTRWHRRRSRR
ncbi:MAG: peptidase dimerization domain-containing protein [Solirubrobacterales bacterium]|nr:peptidase dimerization domain-containing protein [Solirubrobacterales bacterium]